jgi:hypothetical protein
MSQFLRPQSDVSLDSAWADFNTLPISTTISDINDATFIEAQPGTLSATFVVELSPGNTPIAGDRILRWRVSKNEAGGQTRAFSIRLKSATDVVLVDTITGTVGDTFDTYSWVVSEEITDYEGLRVEFTDQRFGTGDDRSIRVAFIEFEIPAAILDVSVEPDLVEYEVEPLAVDVNAERRTTINADLLEAEIDTLSPTIFAVRNESFEVGTINYEVESFEASVSTRETPITVITQNPSLYDKKCPRFILIRNTELKILDGDTINISSFSDYLLLEDEPEGFDNAKLLLERDEEYHGFNYEYQVDALRFDCNYGKTYLDNIFEEDGTDANVIFIYGYGDLDTVDVLYVGGIDFNEWGVEDSEYTVMNIRKDDFGNVLQSNFDVVQQVTLDQNIIMYSKAIPKRVQYRLPRPDLGILTGFINSITNAYLDEAYEKATPPDPSTKQINKTDPKGHIFFNDGKEGNTDFEVFPTYDFQVDSVEPIDPSRLKYLFRATEVGIYNIEVTLWLGIYCSIHFTQADLEDFLTLKVIRTEADGLTVIDTWDYKSIGGFVGTQLLDPNFIIKFEETLRIEMSLEECLYLYVELDTTAASFPAIGIISAVADFPANYNIDQPALVITAETLAPTSNAKFGTPLGVLNSVFKSASLLDYDPVISDFFNDGCGSNLYLTNGANIANVTTDEVKLKLKDSPKGLVSKLGKLFNLGWGIEYDYSMNEVVRIEPAEYFYQDVEILTLNENSISDYVKQVDSSKVFNEIEVGFSRYSKERETNKGNTLDDFHTKHVYSTPIQRNKAKQTIITDLVLSAYEIEITRRKQFEKDGTTTNANLNTDENIFGVQMSTTIPTGEFTIPNASVTEESDQIGLLVATVVLDTVFKPGQRIRYVSRAGVEQTRTVTSFISELITIPLGDLGVTFVPYTGISFAENLVGATTGAGDVILEAIDNVGDFVPESSEPFELIENVISPSTTYNLRYTPKRMLLQHAKMFMGAFRTKDEDVEVIEFKQGDGNTLLRTEFGTGEECLLGDVNRIDLGEGDSLSLAQTFNNEYLFLPYKVTFSYPLSFEELNYIRRAMRGYSEDTNNYGYLSYVNPKGQAEQIYLTSISYSPAKEEAEISGWVKGNYNYIHNSTT